MVLANRKKCVGLLILMIVATFFVYRTQQGSRDNISDFYVGGDLRSEKDDRKLTCLCGFVWKT